MPDIPPEDVGMISPNNLAMIAKTDCDAEMIKQVWQWAQAKEPKFMRWAISRAESHAKHVAIALGETEVSPKLVSVCRVIIRKFVALTYKAAYMAFRNDDIRQLKKSYPPDEHPYLFPDMEEDEESNHGS